MGVGVSGWTLARAVASHGQVGVVSGTALAVLVGRRLQRGDPGGHIRRALRHFPVPEVADRVLSSQFVEGGLPPGTPFRPVIAPTLSPRSEFVDVTVLANFVEIWLAKEGHGGPVGVNLLEKVQLPTLASLYGAMLAGVDYVLMGAGIPRAIPGVLDHFAAGEAMDLRVDVEGAHPGEEFHATFDPKAFCGGTAPALARPKFLAIVSSAVLASTLARKSNGRVDGFVIEGRTAGGHNAPPRGDMHLNSHGEPVYGPRDLLDLPRFVDLGLPFWLAGSFGRPGGLAEARRAGAAGIQVGTAFAFCEESGIMPALKSEAIRRSRAGTAHVFTDPVASPTGFPFKVVRMPGTLSEPEVYEARTRICDFGYLRHPYRKEDGTVGYRCPAEPYADFLRKGGTMEDAQGRKCLCNSLPATVGLGQVRPGGEIEPPLVTAGNDVTDLSQFVPPDRDSYTAEDVLRLLLAESPGA